jgi:hypothetical protein
MSNVSFSTSGPPETVLPGPTLDMRTALDDALAAPPERRRDALADVCAHWPRWSDAWAALGAHARDDVEAYAYFRVGYHRGLDALRQNGWRGNGSVRWAHVSNRGFLRCVDGLRQTAAAIGERDEQQRCDEFLHQLDPEWDRRTD